MRGKRHSLSNEILGIETPKKITQKLDYDRIVQMQQQLIKVLQKEVFHLRQYLLYVAACDQAANEDISPLHVEKPKKQAEFEANDSQNKSSTSSSEPTSSKFHEPKGLIAEVMKLVQAKNPGEIIAKLKVMSEKANRKIQPVFIERIKEKEVPVTIQVIRQVIVEKEVIREKIVEVPIFREKIVEKFVDKPLDSSFTFDNSFQEEERNMKKKPANHNQSFRQPNQSYRPRYQQKQTEQIYKYSKWDKLKKSTRYAEKEYR